MEQAEHESTRIFVSDNLDDIEARSHKILFLILLSPEATHVKSMPSHNAIFSVLTWFEVHENTRANSKDTPRRPLILNCA